MPLRVLCNIPLPPIRGVDSRHFGHCRSPADLSKPYRPADERRSLRAILEALPEGFAPDLFLFQTPEYLPLPEDLQSFRGPKVLLITDWNVCLRYLPDLCQLFDVCFIDAPGSRLLQRAGVRNIFHQPLFGHDPARFRDLGLKRDLDLSFSGSFNGGLHRERNQLVFRLAHWGQQRALHLQPVFDEEYVRVLNRSRAVFNYSVRGEANMRLYEAMACGAAVLVERGNEETPLLFTEGLHYLTYDPDKLEAECDRLFADPARLEAVGTAAKAAVGEQTHAKQLERAVFRAWEMLGRAGGASPSPAALIAARRSLKKLRVLGKGYGLAEACDEMVAEGERIPGLSAETVPALLLPLLETQEAPLRDRLWQQVSSRLRDPAMPAHVRAGYRTLAFRYRGAWSDALAAAEGWLRVLDEAEPRSGGGDPGYGFFYPPIHLGKGMNQDLNRCYREWLETGSHDAYFDLMRNLAHAEAAQACIRLEKTADAFAHALKMSRSPQGSKWLGVSPWPWLFSAALLQRKYEGLPDVVKGLLEENPLDPQVWESVVHGLRAIDEKSLLRNFLKQVLPASRHILPPEKQAVLAAWERAIPE